MTQLDLFPDINVDERERLYVIGNGFDLHHEIESKYWHFKKWCQNNKKDSNLVGLMDIFFSNDREFWGDIENALGDYNEEAITDYCEPENPKDFKFEHPGQWQNGVEDSISWIFGQTMELFREGFNEWVQSIDISNIVTDLFMPKASKYLTFNYTDTLENGYGIPVQNVLHIHGSRLNPKDEYIIGHRNKRDEETPFLDNSILLPYQNAYEEVIKIMNKWVKYPQYFIGKNSVFFKSLNTCKGVYVMGWSYNRIDMPYLEEIASTVTPNCKWLLYYHSEEDKKRATTFAQTNGLLDYTLKEFE